MTKLQRLINYSMRLINCGPPSTDDKKDSSKWLTATKRPIYRLLVLVRNLLHSGVPPDLAGYLQLPPVSSQQLRSQSTHMLAVRRARTTMGERAFSVLAPQEWNNLPSQLRDPLVGVNDFQEMLLLYLCE